MTLPSARRIAMPVLVFLVVLLLPLIFCISAAVFGDEADPRFLEPALHPEKGCVEQIEYMRFYHMEWLKGQRDDAVRGGLRGKVTFDTCKECHPSREKFCNRCHEAASVRLDCFGCHDDEAE